jgi:hypothetical protein
VVTDSARYDDYKARDAAPVRAEMLVGDGYALAARSPRSANIGKADRKFYDAIELFFGYGEARTQRRLSRRVCSVQRLPPACWRAARPGLQPRLGAAGPSALPA